jgi:flavodoxin
MKALVIYDSVFGNTEQVAQAMGAALGKGAKVLKVSEVTSDDLTGLDLLLVGSPTRGFRPTEGIAAFLKDLAAGNLEEVKAAAFDTRIPTEKIKSGMLRFMVKLGGYAAPVITKKMKQHGAQIAAEPEGFFVLDTEGPLVEGELERAEEWAKKLR